MNALICSSLNTKEFIFVGFLSANKKDKIKKLEELKEENKTLIFYEAPHKMKKTLEAILEIFGNRKIVLAREITKIHEEFIDVYKRQGQIEGTGPRYCPSIEDKVVRFSDKERHQIFIEPMGLDTEEMYVQGMSSSLPEDVQIAMYRTIPGLEHVEFTRPAYAIEYDCIEPSQLKLSLEDVYKRQLQLCDLFFQKPLLP